MSHSTSKPAAAPRKSNRVKKVLVWIVLILVLIVVLTLIIVPMVVPGIVKDQITAAVSDISHARTEVQEVSFSWPAKISISGLVLKDDRDQEVASVADIKIDASLLKALTGSYEAEVVIAKPAIIVRQENDGTTNLDRIAIKPGGRSSKPSSRAEPVSFPTLKAKLALTGGTLRFIAKNGQETHFEELHATASLDTIDRPLTFDFGVRTRQGGAFEADGELILGRGGCFDLGACRGRIHYAIEKLDLKELQPAIGSFAAIDRIAGLVNGGGTYALTALSAVNGKGGVTIDGLDIAGPMIGPEPVAFRSVRIEDEIALDSQGLGKPAFTLAVDDYLTARLASEVTAAAGASKNIVAKLEVAANLEGLSKAAASLLKLKPGYRMKGDAAITTDLQALLKDGLDAAHAVVKMKLDRLSVSDAEGRPLPIDPSMTMDLDVRREATGTIQVSACQLKMGTIDLKAGGGFDPATKRFSESSVRADADLDDVSRKLAGFMDLPFAFGGKIKIDAKIQDAGDAARAESRITVAGFRIAYPDGKKIGPLNFSLDEAGTVNLNPGGRSLLERFQLRSAPFDIDASGEVTDIADASKLRIKLGVVVNAELANVLRDLGAFLNLEGYSVRGATHLMGTMQGSGGDLKITGKGTIKEMEIRSTSGGGKPVTVQDPLVTVDLDATSTGGSSNFQLNTAMLDSSFLKGSMNGRLLNLAKEPEFQAVKGDFTYHPEKLSAVLAPWMPGSMRGTSMEKISFTLQGKARDTDWISILRGSTGNGAVGLAPLSMSGYDLAGKVESDVKEEKVTTKSTLRMNGGALQVDSTLDLRDRADARSTLNFTLNNGSLNSKMSPLLGLFSPILAVSEAAGSGMAGLIDASIDISYDGAMNRQTTAGGWDAFPKQNLNGKGRIALSDLAVQGSNFLMEGVRLLGIGDPGRLALDPLEFTLSKGRVFYAQPLNVNMGDFRSAMKGSIGLDKTLDLVWAIPVTDQLVAKHGFLKYWKGGSIDVPVRGSSDEPSIKIEETFASLAKQALEKEAGNLLGGVLGGGKKPGETKDPVTDLLGGLFGGGEKEKKATDLLKQADALFEQGKPAEAAPIYRQIHDDYRKTNVYKKNKDKVKERDGVE